MKTSPGRAAGASASEINGTEVARGDGADPGLGKIGRISEGDPLRSRNLRIRPLGESGPATPTEALSQSELS